jgi:hypothetical protein
MAEQNFSWLTENSLEPVAVPPKEERKLEFHGVKQKLLLHKKTLIILSALLFILIVLKFFQKETVAPLRMYGMAALMPIPKGQVVEGMLIRPITMSPSLLTKAQRAQRLIQSDAEKIMGKVRAKKDIPPNKPILWSDLELIPATKTPTKAIVPVVTYPDN